MRDLTAAPLGAVSDVKETRIMSKVCEVCGKHPGSGNRVSNSYRHTRRRWMPNLQRVKTQTEHGRVRMRVCTSEK